MKKIIILIPHYNSLQDLEASIQAIDETFSVDLMIVDDGSKIKPELKKLQDIYKGGQIFLEILPHNQGIEKALNHGLHIIESLNYEYIGRLDCGDFVKKDKFKKQLDHLDANKNVYLLGTWANVICETGKLLYILKHPVGYKEIKKRMYLNSTFVHPSIVFRKEVLHSAGYYPEDYKSAEDYAFFFKIIKKHEAENYPEVLLDYVVSSTSITSLTRKAQIKSRIKVIVDNFYLGFYPIYGLLRNNILLYTSRNATTFIKKNLYSKK